MKLIINKDRSVIPVGTWGTVNENDYEILDFEFPAELEEYNKRIVYYLGDERVWDTIVNNKAYITNAITTKGDVKAYVWCTKENTEREADTDFRTMLFEMHFYENENADGIVPTQEQVDGFNTMLTAMNNKITEIDTLETAIEGAEADRVEAEQGRVNVENTRVSNENTRQNNEQTRQTQEADRERRTNEAIANIQDKTAEYNANAQAKTTDFNNNASAKKSDFNSNAESKTTTFNNNASSKTSDFNTNATNKTNAFDSNASSKTTSFNNNATSKTTDFNTNAENKTTAFNSNATDKTTNFDNNANSKTTTFNENATSKTNDFNDNATAKTTDFNNNAQAKTEAFDEHTAEMQQEIDELSANMPWTETEQATSIDITDAAKYSKNHLKVFGNTEQDDTTMTYKCDGTETGDYYLTYNSISYYFTMPTIESGNILVFDTTELKLYLNDSEITTSTSGTGTELTFVPSPNPDYPQDIHVVTGNNTIGVNSINYLPNIETQTLNGITITNNKDGSYTLNGTASANTYFDFFAGNFNSKKYENYYLKEYNYDNISSLMGISASAPISYRISTSNRTSIQSASSGQIQIIDNGDNLYFALRINANGVLSNVLIKPMLVAKESELNANVEPYYYQDYPLNLGSLELCKIEDAQDYIYKENGNWYKYGAIRKYNECISSSVQPTSYRCILKHRNELHDMSSTTNILASGMSKNTNVSVNASVVYRSMIRYNYGWSGLTIVYNNKIGNFESGTEVKNWFDNNEVVYVVINTSVDDTDITQITDETLISQLEAIYNHLALVKGTNHITITPSDLAPYVTLNYMQDLPSKLDNLDSRLALLE